MARITIEDCLEKVPNRFKLALLAANRTKSLINGAQPMLDNAKHEKNIVLALREIASGNLNLEELESSVGRNLLYGHGLGYEDDTFITNDDEEDDNFGKTIDSFVPLAIPAKKTAKKSVAEDEAEDEFEEVEDIDTDDENIVHDKVFENDEDEIDDEEYDEDDEIEDDEIEDDEHDEDDDE